MVNMTLALTDNNLAAETAQGVVLVDFWAPWCAPCRMIAPVIEDLATEFEGRAKVAKVNIDENPASTGKYGIMSIPTMLIFKNGQVVETVVGGSPTIKGNLQRLIEKHL